MCVEGVAGMDGAVSTVKHSSDRGTSQASYSSGTRAVDGDMSVMLQSNGHEANMRQGHSVMAPAVSAPLDHLASYAATYSLYPPGYVGSNARPTMQRKSSGVMPHQGNSGHVRPPLAHRGSPPQRRAGAGFNLEEKYVLEAKPEVMEGVSYTSVYENASNPSMALHRFHSAPASTFLAEMNEPNGHPVMTGLYGDAGPLTSIAENMDMERIGTANGNSNQSFNDYEHYMAPENDFARRLAFPANLRKEDPNSSTLLRQSSMPTSVGLSQLNSSVLDRMAENGSDKSSSRNSDDNNHLISGYTASMYSQDDYLWKSPTSPAKRQREGESETSSGSADGSTYRNAHHNGNFVRHMSLPSRASGSPSEMNGNSGSFTAVPMRTRAKRGCATHPRSIAERVRRTKISERMKRLQDLVPDMDKQTNTSDMLDETVEYVKSLQRKVQELTDTVARLQAAAAKNHHTSNNTKSNTNLELGHGVAMEASG